MNLELLEALLFLQAEPISLQQLALWLECDVEEASESVQELAEALADRGSGLTVQRVGGKVRLATQSYLFEKIAERLHHTPPEPLSHASWEVLSIVAYRQPLTRLEIESIRQTGSERALDTLMQRELIEEVGRKESPGRPILYGTTARFLTEFGLDSPAELPALSQEAQPSE